MKDLPNGFPILIKRGALDERKDISPKRRIPWTKSREDTDPKSPIPKPLDPKSNILAWYAFPSLRLGTPKKKPVHTHMAEPS
jgi:hypothetical protein